MSDVWKDFFINVVVGTVAGGVTNAVAVWMLFHPYEKRWGFHGAIPKNKARLAKSIGKVVGEKLLTPMDLLDELTRAGFRETLDARLAGLIRNTLDIERGSLRELLPEPVLVEVERALTGLGPAVADRVEAYTTTPAFEARVREALTRLKAELGDRTVDEVLTAERRAELAAQAAALATDLLEESRNADERSAAARFGDMVMRLAGTDRTRAFVERTVHDALGRAGKRTWADVLDALGEDTVVKWVIEGARSPRLHQLAAEGASKGATALLDRPIGRPSRFFADDASARLAAIGGPALWQWLESELPRFVEQLDIQSMVERKVLGFSTSRIEEIIRGVTQKELTLIVNLGYVLGAVIGIVTFLLGRLLGS